jgi:hypothetical protein
VTASRLKKFVTVLYLLCEYAAFSGGMEIECSLSTGGKTLLTPQKASRTYWKILREFCGVVPCSGPRILLLHIA